MYMIVDKKYIEKLRKEYWFPIDESLERCLLNEYGEEPFPYEWSEQDLYEQIRKISYRYESLKKDRDAVARYALLEYRYQNLCEITENFQNRQNGHPKPVEWTRNQDGTESDESFPF